MDRDEIIAALTALAAELDRIGVSAEMYVVGGAAIALAHRVGEDEDDLRLLAAG